MSNLPRCIVVPTPIPHHKHKWSVARLRNEGVDVQALVEATLVARNQADDHNLKRVGIDYDLLDSLKEEIACVMNPESFQHLEERIYKEVVEEAFKFCFATYLMVKDMLSLVIGDLDDFQSDVICEDWLKDDLVISFCSK